MSYRRLHRVLLAGALCALGGIGLPANCAPWRGYPSGEAPTDRIIVRWRDSGVAAIQIPGSADRAARLSQSTGIHLQAVREIRDRLDVVQLDAPLAGSALRHVVARLGADLAVKYAEPDAVRYALGDPNDPRFNAGSDANGQWLGQWYLKDPTPDVPAAIGATTAWNTATGAPYIIAVLDSGVDYKHPDLGLYGTGGKLLPGRDFICNDSGTNCTSNATGNTYIVANDGDGWDADASDPGNWLTTQDVATGGLCPRQGLGPNHDQMVPSDWHGTRVAGIAAAITNNGIGVAGVAPGAYILPVRVLGKCKGYMSDIVSGMYWAAGLTTTTTSVVPTNTYPAQVLNLSLGGTGACTQTEQDAVTTITQNGHLIVAAAGNDGGPVLAPANCSGVVAVAGIRHAGTKVGYSNVSSAAAAITIAAPAGNCVNLDVYHPYALPCVYSIETTSNDGLTTPDTDPTHAFYTYAQMASGYAGNLLNEGTAGTSFAAPIVSGVAAMMIEANPNMSAAQLIARLAASATPFPVPATAPDGGTCHVAALTTDSTGAYTDVQDKECTCTAATCGAGMLNATAALAHSLYPLASFTTSTDKASVGQNITLDGSASSAAKNLSIASYQWTANPDVSIANASSAKATLVFPALRPVTVTLTVTDSAGHQDTASKTINSVALSAGGGGGALGPLGLLVLAGAAAIRSRRRQGAYPVMLRGWPRPESRSPRCPGESI
ncbi:MAG: S8 family serine peptidase [Gammaproteobacteria bacterium]|nr:S8 family serine peptidase [Gammaproteobacteria bacterium]